ncbi:ATP-dependent RNA helicase DDX1 [Paragonimus westermani]|uniref:ATP-dependent RNA helicase DDX1 n=1 Tax=Paragonimus westermani TaxID=34504 RepID=A0A5J4NKI5_9TREM|nr:ATP-dependent RNA helicase DDX1 [Paragonimus westermani]
MNRFLAKQFFLVRTVEMILLLIVRYLLFSHRMGLAISLVSTVKEKVWYHSNCPNRGRGCYNTRLLEQGGCCIWYNEVGLLGEIEEHLGVTIDTVDSNLVVPTDAFDGKVVYGQKLKQYVSNPPSFFFRVDSSVGPKYQSHVAVLASAVKELHQLERKSQQSYLRLKYGGEITA